MPSAIGVDVEWINDEGGLADHFSERSRRGADHGCPASHRFEWREPEALIQGWEDERHRPSIDGGQFLVRDGAEEDEPLVNASLRASETSSGLRAPVSTSCSPSRSREPREGLHEADKVLVRLLVADVEHVREARLEGIAVGREVC